MSRLLFLTGVFVALLALVAGAISFDHMRELAQLHGQLGWRAYAFPLSVDGLEVVASLYLVAQRRVGHPTGWVPWTSLSVATLASLAANVAVGGDDLIGKALAGWPALSMLAAVKLFFGMFEHADGGAAVQDDQRTTAEVATDAATSQNAVRAGSQVLAASPDHPSSRAVADGSRIAHLIPAARIARETLARDGLPLSRDRLAEAMRHAGANLSNAHASLLVKLLRADDESS